MTKRGLIILAASLGITLSQAHAQSASSNSADALIISAAKPLSKKESKLRREVYERCREILNAPAGKFGAHPSAAAYPGPVAPEAQRITRTVAIKHAPPDAKMLRLITPLAFSDPFLPIMYSTGMYAAPGEVVTVEIPEALAGKLELQIGCHADNLNEWVAAEEDWRRSPLLVNHTKLKATRTQASNPFGGLIYITCPPTAEAWQANITLSNAVAAPLFVLGQTTDDDWKRMLETSGAPWGEIGTTNIIITLPISVLKKIHDPSHRMKLWDNFIGAIMDLAQLPTPFYRAQRLVTDVHIGGGFMHSGYPIMVTHCPEQHMSTEDLISDPARFARPANGPNWGFFHEIGHNMQSEDWVFDGTSEVSVNFFTLYCFDKIVQGRDNAHEDVSNEATQKMLRDYFRKPPDYKKWRSDAFLALVTFRLIQNDFGWDLFKRTFLLYQALPDDQRPKNDKEKRDRFVRYLSETAGQNFAPYFSAWGLPLSDELKAELKKYPEWMPYNFPPRMP